MNIIIPFFYSFVAIVFVFRFTFPVHVWLWHTLLVISTVLIQALDDIAQQRTLTHVHTYTQQHNIIRNSITKHAHEYTRMPLTKTHTYTHIHTHIHTYTHKHALAHPFMCTHCIHNVLCVLLIVASFSSAHLMIRSHLVCLASCRCGLRASHDGEWHSCVHGGHVSLCEPWTAP